MMQLPCVTFVFREAIYMAHDSVGGWSTSWKVTGSIPNVLYFLIDLILPAALWPGIYSAPNRNEYQEFSLVKGRRLACKGDNLTAICEPTV
jgi:hypothetical protein